MNQSVSLRPVARYPKWRIGFLSAAAIGVVLSGGLHEQSPQLTGIELLLGSGIVTLIVWGMLNLLVTRNRPTAPVRLAILYELWCLANAAIALAAGTGFGPWLRLAFPTLAFPGFLILGWGCFRSPQARAGLLAGLAAAAAVVVVVSMWSIRSISVGSVQDLQLLRKLGGNYFSVFAVTLALPLLVTAAGRRVIPWTISALILAIGTLGLGISFTRTFWLATAVSTVILLAMLAWERRADFWRLSVVMPFVIATVLAALVAIAPGNVIDFLVQRVSGLGHIQVVGSLQERLYESRMALSAAVANPLGFIVGNGFGAQFAYEWVNPISGAVYGGLHLQYQHDYYVFLLFTSGVVGLLLFLSVWYSAFRALARQGSTRGSPLRTTLRLVALTAGINVLIASLAAPPLMEYQWGTAFGLLLGAALAEESESPAGEAPFRTNPTLPV
jgi:hypothetical protein